MKIRELKILYFRGIKKMEISLDKQLNVFCGINGAGKRSILYSTSLLLSWIIARIRTGKGSGRPIAETSIKNGSIFSKLELIMDNGNSSYSDVLAKTRKGRISHERSDMSGLFDFAKQIQQDITDNNEQVSVPVFITPLIEL